MTAVWPNYSNQAAALDALLVERHDVLIAQFPEKEAQIEANFANRPVEGPMGDPARLALVIYAAQRSIPSMYAIDALLLENADASRPFD